MAAAAHAIGMAFIVDALIFKADDVLLPMLGPRVTAVRVGESDLVLELCSFLFLYPNPVLDTIFHTAVGALGHAPVEDQIEVAELLRAEQIFLIPGAALRFETAILDGERVGRFLRRVLPAVERGAVEEQDPALLLLLRGKP